MAQQQNSTVTDALASTFSRATVEAEARRLGVVKRQRKVDIFALVATLVFGFHAGTQRTLSAFRQVFEKVTGVHLVPSAFYDRLTKNLAKLLHSLMMSALESAGAAAGIPIGILRGFKDILAIDSSVLRLHDLLADLFPACRTNHTKAAAKLHAVMSVIEGSPRRVRLTDERTNDRTPWRRVGAWVKGCLLLFDLGYYSFHLFDRIDSNGGFFISRVKKNANLLIVAENRRWRGRTIPLVGRRLQEILGSLKREVIDVMVEVEFECRPYRGIASKKRRKFRLVGVLNRETGEYHCYFTNIPAERLTPHDIAKCYSLRWQVELLFKSLKHHCHLDHLPSSKPHIIECLVWASILCAIASHGLMNAVRRRIAADRMIPLLRWTALFSRLAGDMLQLLLHGDDALAKRLLGTLMHEAPDPNRNRKDRALEGLVRWEVAMA